MCKVRLQQRIKLKNRKASLSLVTGCCDCRRGLPRTQQKWEIVPNIHNANVCLSHVVTDL